MKEIISIVLISILSHFAYSQDKCDEKSLKTNAKTFKRNKKIDNRIEASFKLAKCFKDKNDSLSKYYFLCTIDLCKQNQARRDKLTRVLHVAGISYYEIKDYKTAEIYLSKAILRNYADNDLFFYYGVSLLQNEKYKEALDSFEKHKFINSIQSDKLIDENIDKCKLNIKNVR
jgi:tetratricopeptide (TPR) repeat protein